MVTKVLKLLSLNIGNPSKERAQRQCEWLIKRTEDIFVLTETKDSRGCSYIAEFFLQYGNAPFSLDTEVKYYIDFPRSKTKDLGVMIVSKYPIIRRNSYFAEDSIYYARQVEVIIAVAGKEISVVGLYVPSRDRSEEKINRKKKYIESIERYMQMLNDSERVIMGDLNILDKMHIPHYSTFFEWEYNFYEIILQSGYIDAFKYYMPEKQEYSWVGRTRNGYRYDYCFVSSNLERFINSCEYLHETRICKLTDHAAVIVNLEL